MQRVREMRRFKRLPAGMSLLRILCDANDTAVTVRSQSRPVCGVRPVTAYRLKAIRLSKKERRVDALALRAEERRDKLRKAVGRSKYLKIHGSLNGETHMDRLHVSVPEYEQVCSDRVRRGTR